MRYKKIYSKKVYLELKIKHHKLLWLEPNRNKKWLDVFVFMETDNLLNDLTNITKK